MKHFSIKWVFNETLGLTVCIFAATGLLPVISEYQGQWGL